MCHINILVRSKLKDSDKVCGFFQTITTKSFDTNKDGDGVFFSGTNKVYKSENKLNYVEYLEDFKKAHTIISHQRFSTSGKTEDYTHPFESDELIMVHNGVVGTKAKDGHSDTYIMFQEFKSEFAVETGTRTERMTKAIKKCGKDWDNGSYSIAIFDKVEQSMYYFRNGCCINCYEDADYSFITTSAVNDEFLTMIQKEKGKSYTLETYKIYKYAIKGDRYVWSDLGAIERVPFQTTYSNSVVAKKAGYDYSDYDIDDPDEFTMCEYTQSCIYCGIQTPRQCVASYEHICKQCSLHKIGDYTHE
jgi:predicted glutamine amidotransferase